MIKVVFEYDEQSRKWMPRVEGAGSNKEAAQAFNAVVLTCMDLPEHLLGHTIANPKEYGHEIVPCVG